MPIQGKKVSSSMVQLDEEVQRGHDIPQTVEELPPLPRPNLTAMRSESTTGCIVVFVIIGFCVGAPSGVRWSSGWQWPAEGEPWDATAIGFAALYAESVVALLCLLGIMLGDPGTIKRSQERCFPLPNQVVERLRTGRPLTGLSNVYEDGKVYCVRCLIWREDRRSRWLRNSFDDDDYIHHCSTCQRCVRAFDHHCGVFGRCIAGNGCGGNMGYFKLIITMAIVGLVTCFMTIVQIDPR
jgi:hypothetical protein